MILWGLMQELVSEVCEVFLWERESQHHTNRNWNRGVEYEQCIGYQDSAIINAVLML